MNTEAGFSHDSLVSSDKDSDFDLFFQSPKQIQISRAEGTDRNLNFNSVGLDSCKYSIYEQVLYSVQMPHNKDFSSENSDAIGPPKMRRRIALEALKEERKEK